MEQMIQLSGKQRAALRKIAANLDTIFQIGKGGIGENMLRQISDTLDARELIKLRVLDTAEYTASKCRTGNCQCTACRSGAVYRYTVRPVSTQS